MPPQRVLIVGDHLHPDFAGVESWLRRRADVFHLDEWRNSLAHAADPIAPFELAVLMAARPGRFSQEDVEVIHRASPLARLALLAGTWCEGELRTGAAPTGVVRLYWHEWETRLGDLWRSPDREDTSVWRLPRTAQAGERTMSVPLPRTPERLVAVRTRNAASFNALAEALRSAGLTAVWVAPEQPWRVQGAAVLLWEGDVHRAGDLAELQRLAVALRRAVVVALVNFPRPEDVRRVRELGATSVLAKPFLVSALLRRIEAALQTPVASREDGLT